VRRATLLSDRSGPDTRIDSTDPDAVSAAFTALYEPDDTDDPPPHPAVRQAIVDQFHRLYYHSADTTWRDTTYRGTEIAKCPLDLWLYQEILVTVRPTLIIETGTYAGGSAYYLGDVCDTLGRGRVVSVDIAAQPNLPPHDRVTYLAGSSTDPAVVADVTALADGGPVLVILDSDHSEAHVRAELAAYSPLVPVGSYVIVEDTNVHGHPALPTHGPGPMEALDDFLRSTDDFVIDEHMHKFLMTFNPRGYLRRVA
jgi:cephalosporin hydroxylase